MIEWLQDVLTKDHSTHPLKGRNKWSMLNKTSHASLPLLFLFQMSKANQQSNYVMLKHLVQEIFIGMMHLLRIPQTCSSSNQCNHKIMQLSLYSLIQRIKALSYLASDIAKLPNVFLFSQTLEEFPRSQKKSIMLLRLTKEIKTKHLPMTLLLFPIKELKRMEDHSQGRL
jgi:hypothetical protein